MASTAMVAYQQRDAITTVDYEGCIPVHICRPKPRSPSVCLYDTVAFFHIDRDLVADVMA